MRELRKYTASFILDMRGCTDTVEMVMDRLANLVVELGGKVSEKINLGQKMFERTRSKNFQNGLYIQIKFEGEPSICEGIKSKLKLDKIINRILIEHED